MKTFLIKLNTKDERDKGFGWVVQTYLSSDLSDVPTYMSAKTVTLTLPSETFNNNEQYFIKTKGTLTNFNGNVIIS